MRIFSCFLVVLLLVACHSDDASRLKVFRYNQANPLNSLDPAFSKDLASMWACSHIYEGLFILDRHTALQPLLVDSFHLSQDKMTYTFYLKKEVYFHQDPCFNNPENRRKMNAQDVQYSLLRLMDTQLASPGAWTLRSRLDAMQPFHVIDSHTIQIRLNRPFVQFLQVLAMPYCSIVPHEAVEKYDNNFANHPVGTGAFRLKIWDRGNTMILHRNSQYHIHDTMGRPLPYLDVVRISFNENKKTEYLEFKRGKLSFITSPDPILIREILNTQGFLKSTLHNQYQLYKVPFLNTEYFAIRMNGKDSLLGNKNIRKAINYAIDRASIAKYIKHNLVYPADKGYIPIGMPYKDSSFLGYSYQPQYAKTLIQKEHLPLQKIKLEIHSRSDLIEMTEYVAHLLEEVGFEVKIKLHTAEMLNQLAAKSELPFFRRTWIADYPDPENFMSCFYSRNSTPPNYTKFSNKEFDDYYERCQSEFDLKLRKKYYQKMEEIIQEESPVVPIFYESTIRLTYPNIRGLKPNALNQLDLKYIQIQ